MCEFENIGDKEYTLYDTEENNESLTYHNIYIQAVQIEGQEHSRH